MNGSCFECGKPAEHDHHVVPKSLGGTKTVPLCEECHSKVHGTDLRLSELQKLAVKKTVLRFKEQGRKWGGGGWNKTTPETISKIKSMREQGMKLDEIATEIGLTATTVCRLIKKGPHTTERHKHY